MRVRTGARAVRTGQVFLVRKVILEFSAGLSGWENLSIQMEAFRTLLMSVQIFR
jgi:hypothetical protein